MGRDQRSGQASRRLVTCAFCDLADSTAIAEQADPELLRDLMLAYYEQMRAVVERHGGRVEKFLGDAVAAVWGIPTALEDGAVRAVRAALEMTEVAETLRSDFEAATEVAFALRVGVASGEAMVSPQDLTQAAAVLGDAMNTAARLQTAANPGEVMIDEVTHRLAGASIQTDPPMELELKGKAGAVIGYRVRAATATVVDRSGRTGPLAGRDREVAAFDSALAEVTRTSSCRLLLVTGEPGVGKSRLAAEFARRNDCTMLRGRCLPYGEGIAYWPLAEIVRTAARIDPGISPDQARLRVRALMDGDPDAARAAEVIAQTVGLVREGGATAEITWATHRLLRRLAAGNRAVIVCIDDVQWSEQPLLELVLSLPAALADVPLLVLCLARPEVAERHADWPAEVRLEPLVAEDASALVRQLWPDATESVISQVAERSGGNPLFAEELVAMLATRAVSEEAVGDLAVMPDSLRALLGARLDMLLPEARSVLVCGAIEGEVFHERAIHAMALPSDRQGIQPHLALLVKGGVIHPEGARTADPTYRFHHLLVRDALYSSTPKRHRADLHVALAEWILAPAGLGTVGVAAADALAGYHFEQAVTYRSEVLPRDDHGDLRRKASRHLASAGDRARAMGDVDAALSLYTRATAVLPEGAATRLELAPRLGEAMAQTGRLDAAVATLEQALEDVQEAADPSLTVRCDLALQEARMLRGDPDAPDLAAAAIRRALEVLAPRNDHAGLAQAWRAQAGLALHDDDLNAMADALEHAADHAQRAGDERQVMDSHYWLTLITWLRPQHVMRSLQDVDRIAGNVPDNRMVRAAAQITNGVLHAMSGAPEIGRHECEAGREMLLALGQRVVWGGSVLQAGLIERLAGDYASAERLYRASIASSDGAPGFQATISLQLANVLYEQGRFAEADMLCRDGEAYADSTDVVTACMTRWLRALLLAHDGDLPGARRLARDALGMTDARKSMDTRIEALLALAWIEIEAGAPTAHNTLVELVELVDQRGYDALLGRVERLQALLGSELGASADRRPGAEDPIEPTHSDRSGRGGR